MSAPEKPRPPSTTPLLAAATYERVDTFPGGSVPLTRKRSNRTAPAAFQPERHAVLTQFLSEGLLQKAVLRSIPKPHATTFVQALVELLFVQPESGRVLVYNAILLEFENHIRTPREFLRGNDINTKFITEHLRVSACEYLRVTLSPVLHSVLSADPLTLDIDPFRISDESVLHENQKRNIDVLASLWNTLTLSVSECPPIVRSVLGHVSDLSQFLVSSDIRQQSADFGKEASLSLTPLHRSSLLGSIFFLRYVCPAIVSPDIYLFSASSLQISPDGF
eukprot:TRINITY_DN12496_c0_g1_i1.p1 TRINITY_DN12496_c0_g1~~TRINITY_DN12496_c0_g1_i1.p1  ORF type:complete len:278 (+),score=78.06 TRINITY_DN12496_c0_g1_i1:2-835(+)